MEPLVFPIEVWLRVGQIFKEPTVTYCVLNVSTTNQLVKLELSWSRANFVVLGV